MEIPRYLIIAPVGDNLPALFVGIKTFPAERVLLLSPPNRIKDAQAAKKDLTRFNIPCEIIEITGNIWETLFVKIAEIKEREKNKHLLVNTATGDRTSTCAATSAAFVNGIKAFSVENNEAMLLPVMKFSYYKLLSEKKLKILQTISQPGCCNSLEEIARKTNMSLPLIAYHINGNLKSEGLHDLGLVETSPHGGRVAVTLTLLGKLLLKGYIPI